MNEFKIILLIRAISPRKTTSLNANVAIDSLGDLKE